MDASPQDAVSDLRALRANAQGLLEVGRPDKAVAVVLQGLAEAPDDPDLLFLLTRAQLATGNTVAAVETAEHLLSSDPQNARSHWIYAIAVSERWPAGSRKLRDLAIPAAEEATRLAPLSAQAHYVHAFCLAKSIGFFFKLNPPTRTFARVRKAALQAVELAPSWVPPLLLLSSIEKTAGRKRQAAEYAETALRLDPTDSESLLSDIEKDKGWSSDLRASTRRRRPPIWCYAHTARFRS